MFTLLPLLMKIFKETILIPRWQNVSKKIILINKPKMNTMAIFLTPSLFTTYLVFYKGGFEPRNGELHSLCNSSWAKIIYL